MSLGTRTHDVQIVDQGFWDSVLVYHGLAVIEDPVPEVDELDVSPDDLCLSREYDDPLTDQIIGCPHGKKFCVFAGGSCEDSGACHMIGKTENLRRHGI